ncbi:MAG: putative recombinase, partial [Rubritepida sp.]|nr:putative recombinase [Rubritepida sp.]
CAVPLPASPFRPWKTCGSNISSDKLRRELQAVERKLSNLLDALAEGLRSSGLQDKISGLEAERDRLTLALEDTRPIQLRLLPNLGQAYRRSVERLRDALAAGDNPAALEPPATSSTAW